MYSLCVPTDRSPLPPTRVPSHRVSVIFSLPFRAFDTFRWSGDKNLFLTVHVHVPFRVVFFKIITFKISRALFIRRTKNTYAVTSIIVSVQFMV